LLGERVVLAGTALSKRDAPYFEQTKRSTNVESFTIDPNGKFQIIPEKGTPECSFNCVQSCGLAALAIKEARLLAGLFYVQV
jgi:hypothetical protein